VVDIIDALITDGRLATTGGNRPKVVLVSQAEAKAETEVRQESHEGKIKGTEVFEDSPAKVTDQITDSVPAQDEPDPALLEALRTWRTEQAKSQGVPPYIVFSNKILEAIAVQRPTTVAELGKISGVGPAKLEQYGAAVIALVGKTLSGDETQNIVRERPEALRVDAEAVTSSTNFPKMNGENRGDEQIAGERVSNQIQNPEPKTPYGKSTVQNPLEAVLAVVCDLDGLLSPTGLSQLLTAAPGEVVPFSDHELCGIFHDTLTPDVMEAHIQEAIQTRQLALTPRQRLILVQT
jgi:hypothetical protein